jgi:hypothetical protein
VVQSGCLTRVAPCSKEAFHEVVDWHHQECDFDSLSRVQTPNGR